MKNWETFTGYSDTYFFRVPPLYEQDLLVKSYYSFMARCTTIGAVLTMGGIHPFSSYSIVSTNMDFLHT